MSGEKVYLAGAPTFVPMEVDCRRMLEEGHRRRTLLGVAPLTEEIVTATIVEARDHGFTPVFVTSPLQVDAHRGYTGWSQAELVATIDRISSALDFDGSSLIARHHGGPYQGHRDRDDPSIDLPKTMEDALDLFAADLGAGFDLLHVDATADPRLRDALSLEEIARRTVRLLHAIEDRRETGGHDPVWYAIGSSNIGKHDSDRRDLDTFLDLVSNGLHDAAPDVMDRLLIVMGDVGTDVRLQMTNEVDVAGARSLVAVAERKDLYLQIDYGDWLESTELEQFPELGIGSTIAGPEFTTALIDGLAELETLESSALESADADTQPSTMMATLRRTAIQQAPWERYVSGMLDDPSAFAETHREAIARCTGRYVLRNPDVTEARAQLYANLERHDDVDPAAFLVDRVCDAIHRYVTAFRLA